MTFRDEPSDGKKKDRKTVFGDEGGKKHRKGKKGGLKEENLRRKTLSAPGFWDKVATLARDDAVLLC